MDYSKQNRKTYDALAEEYEERVGALTGITEEAMRYFSSYIKPSGSVLDIGCGVGIAINILTKNGFKVTGVEISPKMAEFARKRNPGVDVIVGDFLNTDFNSKFDAILAFAFIHLFPKSKSSQILNKIKSVLKPDGVALISSTRSSISKEGWEVKDDYIKKQKRFRKFWTENELAQTIDEAGFKRLALQKYTDPFGKVWMDFVARKI